MAAADTCLWRHDPLWESGNSGPGLRFRPVPARRRFAPLSIG